MPREFFQLSFAGCNALRFASDRRNREEKMPNDPSIDYEALAAAMQRGDAEAMSRFWQFFCQPLWAYFRQRGLTPAEADDLVADCMLHIFKKVQKYNQQNFKGWVFRVAHNFLVDWLRKNPRRRDVSLDDHPEVFELEEESRADLSEAEEVEIQQALTEALQQLPPQHAKTFVLREFHGASYKEIGAQLDASPATVRQWYWRARQKLQELLQDDRRLDRLLARFRRSQTKGSAGHA